MRRAARTWSAQPTRPTSGAERRAPHHRRVQRRVRPEARAERRVPRRTRRTSAAATSTSAPASPSMRPATRTSAGSTEIDRFCDRRPAPGRERRRLDAFAAKLTADGSAVTYATYLGGAGEDNGLAIAIDPLGNAYLAGDTNGSAFPTQSPFQPASGTGRDGSVSKLNVDGSALGVLHVSRRQRRRLNGEHRRRRDGQRLVAGRRRRPTSPPRRPSSPRSRAGRMRSSRSSRPPAPRSSTRRTSAATTSTPPRTSRSTRPAARTSSARRPRPISRS